MKKLFALFTVIGFLSFGAFNSVYAQEGEEQPAEEVVEEAAPVEEVVEEPAPAAEPTEEVADAPAEDKSFTQVIKQKFIEGGPGFMGIVLVCLILGLAIVIERIIYLNMATTNTDKLLNNIEEALNSGGVEAAKEVCRDTKGPVASIFYQGLDRSHEGIDMVEKSVVSYGGVQMGFCSNAWIYGYRNWYDWCF
jgi:biopolymer transport protein ExbB